MNPRALILITLAGVGVILVFLLTRTFLASSSRPVEPVVQQVAETPAVKILVAAADLPVGTIIVPEHVVAQEWPETGVNKAYYRDNEAQITDLTGKVVRSPMRAGAPITRTALVAPGQRGFMAAILNPGMRAVTISLTAESSIGGFVYPGDRVDVILTHRITRDGTTHDLSETVLSNVRVLGVDQASEKDQAGVRVRKTATLEVTPKMAEKVAVMKRIGALSLALRSLANSEGAAPADPDSPPISYTLSATQDAEVSGFLPKLGQNKAGIQVDRGAARTIIKLNTGEETPISGQPSGQPSGQSSGTSDNRIGDGVE